MDPRYQEFMEEYTAELISSGLNNGREPPMRGLIPAAFAGKDIRLLLAKDNPIHLGFWFQVAGGHERVYLHDLVSMGFSITDVEKIEVGYLY